MDVGGAVDDLGDAPGELAGGHLALLAEAQHLHPELGDDRHWMARMATATSPATGSAPG